MKPSTANRILMVMALLWLLAACTGADAELVEPEATPVATATRVPTATPTAVPIPWPTIDPTPPRPGLGEPCDYPCWMGLVPGESTVDEVFWAVNAVAAETSLFRSFQSDGGFRLIGRVHESDRIQYRVEAFVDKDGMSRAIDLKPWGDWPTLGEIVDELGKPDAFSIPWPMHRLPTEPCSCSTLRPGRLDWSQLPPPCVDVINGECVLQYWSIILTYADRGLILFTKRYLEEFPCVCREMLVDQLSLGPVPATVLDYEFHWPGFGPVDTKQLQTIGAVREGSDP